MTIDVDAAPASAADVYLRLHLLSHRLCRATNVNLDGLFGLLTNVAWTNLGPVAVDRASTTSAWRVRLDGRLLDGPRPRQVPAR